MCGVQTAVKMEEFLGQKYVMVKSENFDDLLIFLDIGFLQRQVAMTIRPVQHITKNNDGTYTLHNKCALFKAELVFFDGEEFDEKKPDGITVRALISIDGNKLRHRQVEDNGRTLNHVYEFYPDKMIITTTGVGMKKIVKRYFTLVR